MRSAAEAILRCRVRSLPVSTLSEVARDATPLAGAAESIPVATVLSGHAESIANRQAPIRGLHAVTGLRHQASGSLSSSHPAGALDRQEAAHRRPCAAPAAPRPPLAAAGAASQPLLSGSSHTGPRSSLRPSTSNILRGFAASAAGGRRGDISSTSGHEVAAEVVAPDEAARLVLEDPMARLMASRGMPVGLSLRGGATDRAAAAAAPTGSREPAHSGGGGGSDSDSDSDLEEAEDLTRPPPAEPAYQMEAFSDMLRATAAAAAARRGGGGGGDDPRVDGAGGEGGFTAGVQHVGPSLEDSWGTTRESPADIARRIVESNLDAARAGRGGAAPSESPDEDDDDDDDDGAELPQELSLSPSEQKYASLEAMSADIKKLDEVFEVLASVPWLDENVLAEKELKGVAQVGLLGTLEEVGFNIRPQLLRIWSGERGADLAAGPGLEFRDQAALLAILYHTQQIEDQHGLPQGGYLPGPPAQ